LIGDDGPNPNILSTGKPTVGSPFYTQPPAEKLSPLSEFLKIAGNAGEWRGIRVRRRMIHIDARIDPMTPPA
jgi:hypothetical protein